MLEISLVPQKKNPVASLLKRLMMVEMVRVPVKNGRLCSHQKQLEISWKDLNCRSPLGSFWLLKAAYKVASVWAGWQEISRILSWTKTWIMCGKDIPPCRQITGKKYLPHNVGWGFVKFPWVTVVVWGKGEVNTLLSNMILQLHFSLWLESFGHLTISDSCLMRAKTNSVLSLLLKWW